MPQPRIPTRVRKLHGTYRAPKRGEVVAAGEDLKTAPKFLNARQRGIWQSSLAAAPTNLLKRIDRDLLASWVLVVDQQRAAARELEVATDPGRRLLLQRQIRDTVKVMTTLSDRLGFSPAARSRVEPEAPPKEPAPDDPWMMLKLLKDGAGG